MPRVNPYCLLPIGYSLLPTRYPLPIPQNLPLDPLYFPKIHSHIALRREIITVPAWPAFGGPILTNVPCLEKGGAGNGETP